MPSKKKNTKDILINFPSRPLRLLSRARKKTKTQIDLGATHIGLASSSNRSYIHWLKKRSMNYVAKIRTKEYSGKAKLWQNPYGVPRPRAAVQKASVWYTAYPLSMTTSKKESVLEALADKNLWSSFQDIGIKAMHTGPMKQAGGLDGWLFTPSIDGHFDRISNDIDSIFGKEREFRKLTKTANEHDAIIIDDLIPGHTGKGPDFRLAEMAYKEYPGIYHMIEIDPLDWKLLPKVPKGKDSANLSPEAEKELKKAGYIVGKLQRVIFFEPGVKETNWSATKEVRGVDGIKRRWVYLHNFKEGQPTLNWLDPTFAGTRLVVGDALHSLDRLGSSGLRLDMNGLLGVEVKDEDESAWSENHPLSVASNHLISGMVRKAGGFTFQELNSPLEDIKKSAEGGADLSYDFINRPAYHHALVTSDTSFLKLTLQLARDYEIEPATLVHALQNHDELTWELVHFFSFHSEDLYAYKGKTLKGSELRSQIQSDLKDVLLDQKFSYNAPFTENGIACTTASVITAVLGYEDVYNLDNEQVEEVKKAHLLLSAFNALQPGVFALSGWDLVGALPLRHGDISELLEGGDTRWLNRGSYDLVGKKYQDEKPFFGMPQAQALYDSLPNQLKDEESYASQLKVMLEVRDRYKLATGEQLEIIENLDKRVLGLVHKTGGGKEQLTLLNFSGESFKLKVMSGNLPQEAVFVEVLGGGQEKYKVKNYSFELEFKPYGIYFLVEDANLI